MQNCASYCYVSVAENRAKTIFFLSFTIKFIRRNSKQRGLPRYYYIFLVEPDNLDQMTQTRFSIYDASLKRPPSQTNDNEMQFRPNRLASRYAH